MLILFLARFGLTNWNLCSTTKGHNSLFMTQFFLVYLKTKDEYLIKSIGLAYRSVRIPRPDGINDEDFRKLAQFRFKEYLDNEQIVEGEIIETGYIF